MIDYATVGTNDFAASSAFFDAVLATLGHRRTHDYSEQGWLAYGRNGQANEVTLWLCKPYDGQPATVGNGTMIAFSAQTRAQVDAFHAAALAHGGRCEGPPGIREQYGPDMYLAYVRDPMGNKFSVVCRTPG
jgi:catechol 2,3-dioxygenase-like lactoylglutathione lyase family enzyme